MKNPDTYEESMTQAEAACTALISELLELRIGQDMNIGVHNGAANGATFDIGGVLIGDTVTFNAQVHTFRASLDVYNRDRAQLQKWIMRLLHNLPINQDYRPASPLREDTNVMQLRVVPSSSSVGKIRPTTVEPKGSATAVPTWTCTIHFDVVFVCDEDADVSDLANHDNGNGMSGGVTGGDEPSQNDDLVSDV